MTITKLCRQRLHERLNIPESSSNRSAEQVFAEISAMTESLDKLLETARPRLIMGGIRYASKWEHDGLMSYMQEKFDNYRRTGNYEMLVDFVNFVAIEGHLKTHPMSHFKGCDRP